MGQLGKRASGRKKTLAELGVARLPKARELWAKEHFAKRGGKVRRRRAKTAIYSHKAMWQQWRALPDTEREVWRARQERMRVERADAIRRRKQMQAAEAVSTALEAATHVARAPGAGETSSPMSCSGASELDDLVAPAIVDEVRSFPWCDERSGAARKMELSSHRILPLGGGSYGLCMAVVDREIGESFCAKIAQDGDGAGNSEEALRSEYDVLRRCSHPGVMRAHAMVRLPCASQRLLMILPRCDYNMKVWLHDANAAPLGEGRADRKWQTSCLLQLARALAHVHGIGFVHLDVKPENVLVDVSAGRLLLADFGMAAAYENVDHPTKDARMIQTEVYRPWDLFHAANSFVRLRPRHDAWAFGCVAYEVAQRHPGLWREGRVPRQLFADANMRGARDAIRGTWMARVESHMLPAYKPVVEYCLTLPVVSGRHLAPLVSMSGALQILHQI